MATPKGKQVAIDHSPVNYSAGAQLESHLAGIDTALGGKASTTHASEHVLGGGDELDGDEVDIDFTPSNYTPTTGTPGTNVDHLAAHLRGIDATLGSAVALSDTVPVNVTKAAASAGVGATASRYDHKHDVTTAAPSTGLTGTSTNSEGTATSLARSDHLHSIVGLLSSTAPVNVTKAAAAAGTATSGSRQDHKHDVTTAAPTAVGTANSEGTATSLARSDHVHDASALLPRDGSRTVTGTINFNNNDVDNAKTVSYNGLITGSGNGAQTITWSNGNKQKFTLSGGNATFTFVAPAGQCNLVLELVQDATGGRTVTWPSSVKWPNDTAPTLTTTGSRTDLICFFYDGTNYVGGINKGYNFT